MGHPFCWWLREKQVPLRLCSGQALRRTQGRLSTASAARTPLRMTSWWVGFDLSHPSRKQRAKDGAPILWLIERTTGPPSTVLRAGSSAHSGQAFDCVRCADSAQDDIVVGGIRSFPPFAQTAREGWGTHFRADRKKPQVPLRLCSGQALRRTPGRLSTASAARTPLRMTSWWVGFDLSHPSRKQRAKDGAPIFVPTERNRRSPSAHSGQAFDSVRCANSAQDDIKNKTVRFAQR